MTALTPTTKRQNDDQFHDLDPAQQMGYRSKNFIFQQPKGKGGGPPLVTILVEAHSSPSTPLCMHLLLTDELAREEGATAIELVEKESVGQIGPSA